MGFQIYSLSESTLTKIQKSFRGKENADICVTGLTKLVNDFVVNGKVIITDLDVINYHNEKEVWPSELEAVVKLFEFDLDQKHIPHAMTNPIHAARDGFDGVVYRTCEISKTEPVKPTVTREVEELKTNDKNDNPRNGDWSRPGSTIF